MTSAGLNLIHYESAHSQPKQGGHLQRPMKYRQAYTMFEMQMVLYTNKVGRNI